MPAGHLPGGTGNGAGKRLVLAQRRKALGLTQEDLADVLGVERSTVVRWEHGETEPQPWIRPKLAKALQVRPDRLTDLLAADGPGSAQPAARVVPRQLPAAVADFTGRADELAALSGMVEEAAGAAGTVVISAIGGTAGVGKTALALHWAHQVTDRFPDGQLHVNLRGFDPSGTPAEPDAAIRGFLDALGVPPERIPAQPEAQAGLYRSLLADKRMLVVLDNARDEEQVRPLLPASPGCLVLVTSRNQLSGLAAADGARMLSLDVLAHDEAVQLLTARLGSARAGAEPGAVKEIASLCAHLPLALAVAAARAAERPGFPLAALAAELRAAAGRLDALDAGNPAASVRAVFSWSYAQLGAEVARLFRLLGLHPGPDISVPAVASLAGTEVPTALRLLRELARAHLVTEHVPGRYAFHDLLRAYAADQADDVDSQPEREAAVGRVLDHYLHTANRAALILNIAREVSLAAPTSGTVPEQPADHRSAMSWFDAEHLVLLATVRLAAESGFDSHAWQLAWAMHTYRHERGHYHEWAAAQRTALAAAARLGDINGQAVSGRLLAHALYHLGDYDQARSYFGRYLELCQRAGNRVCEAKMHLGLGELAGIQGRYAEALRHSEEGLHLCQAIGAKTEEAMALRNIGWCYGLLGEYEQARAVCRRALSLGAEIGFHRLEGYAWDSLGYAEHHLGNFSEAAACYECAVADFREFGQRYGEAGALSHLGDTLHAAGSLTGARKAWQQALAILEDLQHPDANKIRARLASAGG